MYFSLFVLQIGLIFGQYLVFSIWHYNSWTKSYYSYAVFGYFKILTSFCVFGVW